MLQSLLAAIAVVMIGSAGLLAAPPLVGVANAATPESAPTLQGWVGTIEFLYAVDVATSSTTLSHLQKATHVTGEPGSTEFTYELVWFIR